MIAGQHRSITRSQRGTTRFEYSRWSFEELRDLAMQLRLRDVAGRSRRELLELFDTGRHEAEQ